MKIGFHTNPWGMAITNIQRLLDSIAELGFQGVDFSQRPDKLGVHSIAELSNLLRDRNLELLGLAGGTLEERMLFCGDVHHPEYLQVEDWDAFSAERAIEAGYRLALHPRPFKPIRRLNRALALLDQQSLLWFLPDMAHLSIVGDDPLDAIQTAYDRLIAIHLKDWTAQYGRSCHQYRKGFVQLGKGQVNLDGIVDYLKKQSFSGWVVAEIDGTKGHPYEDLRACAGWLTNHGMLPKCRTRMAYLPEAPTGATPFHGSCEPDAELRFLRRVLHASAKPSDAFYNEVTSAFAEFILCYYSAIWAYSPAQDTMGCLALTPLLEREIELPYVLKGSSVLSTLAVDRQRAVVRFDPRIQVKGRSFEHPNVLTINPKIHELLTIPIYNSENRTHARLLVNLLPKSSDVTLCEDDAHRLGSAVGAAADSVIQRHSSYGASSTNLLAAIHRDVKGFLNELCRLITDLVNVRRNYDLLGRCDRESS